MSNIYVSNIHDINKPEPINNFELMNDIQISKKDLRKLSEITLLQEKIDHNSLKKYLKKIKGVIKYE